MSLFDMMCGIVRDQRDAWSKDRQGAGREASPTASHPPLPQDTALRLVPPAQEPRPYDWAEEES